MYINLVSAYSNSSIHLWKKRTCRMPVRCFNPQLGLGHLGKAFSLPCLPTSVQSCSSHFILLFLAPLIIHKANWQVEITEVPPRRSHATKWKQSKLQTTQFPAGRTTAQQPCRNSTCKKQCYVCPSICFLRSREKAPHLLSRKTCFESK